VIKEGFKLGLDSRSGRVVHIDQVDEGFEYGVCPDCTSPLVASNRNPEARKKVTYFRHKAESNCQSETLIHLWAKQVVASKGEVLGAEYKAVGKVKDLARKFHYTELVQAPERLSLVNAELEKRLTHGSEFKTPDVLCEMVDSGLPLAVEVFVNNAVNDRKASFFVDQQLDCLEIDLSSMPPNLIESPAAFEKYVIYDAPRIWVYCSLYRGLEEEAQCEANKKAELASQSIVSNKDHKRRIKLQWREDNLKLIKLVEVYSQPDNQKRVVSLYHSHLDKTGTLSNSYKRWLDSNFGGLPDIINIPLKGELCFNCHRSVWQWEVYQRVVLYTHYKSTQRSNKPVKTTYFARVLAGSDAAYDIAEEQDWYDRAPKWSPKSLYESIKDLIPQNKISSEAERVAGEAFNTEKDKPDSLAGLKHKEWQELPKPICTIRRYIKELLKLGILEVFPGDTYVVPPNAHLPLIYDVSNLKV